MGIQHVDVAVVGGGIAGLAAAYQLQTRGVSFVLAEGSARWGGLIHTGRRDGFLLEAGPDSFLAQKPAALDLCHELGLESDLVSAGEPRNVYVVRGGRLRALPPGLAMGAPSDLPAFLRSRLFTWRGKARMALEPLVPRGGGSDESIASFFRRRLGREALEVLGQPLLAGIHAGDAERLSLRSTMPRLLELESRYGSLGRGLQIGRRAAKAAPGPAFYTLRNGLGALSEALVARLPPSRLRLNASTHSLSRSGSGYAIETTTGETVHARTVLLAVPPRSSAQLLRDVGPGLAAALAGIRMASTATVLLGYRRQDVGHPLDGHGLLVPRGEGIRTTACTFVSSKFPFRAPDGHVLLRAFIGGAQDPGAVGLGAPGLLTLARRELQRLLHITAAPVVARAFLWPEAMPQMETGHAVRMESLQQGLRSHPGLFLTGAGLRGTGIPDCIADAQRAADEVVRFVGASRAA